LKLRKIGTYNVWKVNIGPFVVYVPRDQSWSERDPRSSMT